jgi:hypothetical protein
VSELIIDGTFLRIAEDFVGLLAVLELVFRGRIVGIAVRMIFHGKTAISLLDVGLGCSARHIQ